MSHSLRGTSATLLLNDRCQQNKLPLKFRRRLSSSGHDFVIDKLLMENQNRLKVDLNQNHKSHEVI